MWYVRQYGSTNEEATKMAFIKKFIDGFKTKNQEQNYNTLHENLSILEVEKKLKRSNELANIANKTTDRDEFYRSINKFIDNRVKNIDSFNKKTAENTLPRIICIVNEANEFLKYISTPLERLFMNSNMVGIYFILFSRFSLKSLSLGIIGELLEVSTADKLKILLSKNESANYKQSMTRNFDDMGGHQFEHFCADILRKNGFENVEVTQGSGDHGIDILAEKDDITYAIQCKRYDKPIGNDAVQQAIAGKGFYHRDIAVVMTNRNFTPQAIEEAKALGVKLWDRDRLNKMIGRGKIAPVQDKDGD